MLSELSSKIGPSCLYKVVRADLKMGHTNICNGIFHISFFKALLINEGETTQGKQDSGRNDPVPITGYRETGQLNWSELSLQSGQS
jgi:hypothetical protein